LVKTAQRCLNGEHEEGHGDERLRKNNPRGAEGKAQPKPFKERIAKKASAAVRGEKRNSPNNGRKN
jgi:hypothetical protein